MPTAVSLTSLWACQQMEAGTLLGGSLTKLNMVQKGYSSRNLLSCDGDFGRIQPSLQHQH